MDVSTLRRRVCTAILVSSFTLAWMNVSAQEPIASDYVIEHFEVGEDAYVRALALSEATNSLWVGTSSGVIEIDISDDSPRQTFTRADGLANEYVFAIGVAPSGAVWFGTNAGGASVYDKGEWETYFPMHGLADYWVYAFDFDDDENVWIGTWEGANYFNSATKEFTTYRDELINIWVYGVDIDKQGAVWLGTEGGVTLYDHGDWKSWNHTDGLGAPDTTGLPSSPNTGLGTRSRHDLNVTTDGSLTYNPNYVFSVKVDDTGRGMWFGTWGGGASLFDGESHWMNYTVDDGLSGNLVYSLAQAPDETMWFGTDNGISSFDGENWHVYRDGLPGRHFYAIAVQENGVVWAGTKGAVVKLTPVSKESD